MFSKQDKNIMGRPKRVSIIASLSCCSSKPTAKIFIKYGAATNISNMNNSVNKINIFRKLLVCKSLAFLPSLASMVDKTGIIVVLIELINMEEIIVVAVCAIKKASLSTPAPNLDAISTSLKKPRILLINVNIANINTDFIALLVLVKVVRPFYF